MPSRKKMIIASAKKGNASHASSIRDRSLTPSQSEYQEDQQDSEGEEESRPIARLRTQREIQRRQAREMEIPPHPNDYQLVLAMTQATRKRTINFPYDDCINKRTKIAGDYPWEWNNGRLEQPPSPFDLVGGNGLSGAVSEREYSDPIRAMGTLATLPTEIRDEIFRYLLLCKRDICVFRGWSLVFPRRKPRLDLAILYTCQVLRHQGLRILFGENTFRYRLRDPSDADRATSRVIDRVFANCVVPIDQHGHLVRHIKIRVPANRMHYHYSEQSLVGALRKFLPAEGGGGGDGDGQLLAPANLHTLTLEVDAVTQRDLKWHEWGDNPDEVPICRLLGPGTRVREALLRLPVQWVRVVARCHGYACETKCDLRYLFKQNQKLEALTAMTERLTITTPTAGYESGNDGDGSSHERGGEGKGGGGGATDAQLTMEESWERNVNQAKAQLCNLSWRIEILARDPGRAINELHLWTRVAGKGARAFNSGRRGRNQAAGSTYYADVLSLMSGSDLPSVWSSSSSASLSSLPSSPEQALPHGRTTTTPVNEEEEEEEEEEPAVSKSQFTAEWLENVTEGDAEDGDMDADADADA
ncbi:hypothetical protein F4809DRAFT_656987 [Biscogniauxia mediterranea]|nr:hypothetical protein F4809DRAFT_656987 [Biscogniauxia mediterranea]